MLRRVLVIAMILLLFAPLAVMAAPVPLPNAREVLLDVAVHKPNLLIRINTEEELYQLNIHPNVRVTMLYALAYGSWILTTRTVVTSGRYTGRPMLAIGGHARYFYFAYESGVGFVGDGSDDPGDGIGGAVAAGIDGESISEFGQNLTDIGMGIAQLGAAKGNAKAQAIGLGIAGIGLAINAVGKGLQVAEDLAAPPSTPKQGHVDSPPSGGGPAGSAPSGPVGGPGPNGEGPGAVSAAPPGFGMGIGLTGPDGSTAGGGAGSAPGSAPGPSGGGGSTGDSGVGDE